MLLLLLLLLLVLLKKKLYIHWQVTYSGYVLEEARNYNPVLQLQIASPVIHIFSPVSGYMHVLCCWDIMI